MKFNLLIIIIISLFLSMICYADSALPTPVAKVVWIKGNLTATMPSKEERKLQKDSVVYLHDTLETDDNSQAQLVFTDGSLMTLEKDTKFTVDNYNYTPNKDPKTVGRSLMGLVKGGFRTITGIIAKKNHDDYAVKTPVATIGVRGTDYVVHLENNDLYIGQYEGTPCVRNERKVLCLDEKNKYGKVGLGQDPVYLTDEPVYFKEKLLIVPAKAPVFDNQTKVIYLKGNGTSGGGNGRSNGNSFCIQ